MGGASAASAATVRSSKSKFAIYTCIVRTCESTLQAVAIGGWLQSGRSRVRALLWNSVFFSLSFSFFPPLLFPLSSFSPLPSLYLSPFLFPLHARSATSMLKHFSSLNSVLINPHRTHTQQWRIQRGSRVSMEPPFQQKTHHIFPQWLCSWSGDSALQQKLCKLASWLSRNALGMPSFVGFPLIHCGILFTRSNKLKRKHSHGVPKVR